jgi:dihydroxyacetone kinase
VSERLRLQVAGMTWTVRVVGRGHPVLFLHGFSGSGLSWAGIAGLGSRIRAIVPDLPFVAGDEVALMVNGLGGTPITELYLLYGIAHKKLAAKGIKVFRSYVGEYCTSLEMAGAHLSLLKVDAELKQLLLAPAEVAYRVF